MSNLRISSQGRTIRKVILSISEHPHQLVRMSWEGLYVALSRVKFRDDIRLLLRNGDRSTMGYIKGLRKNDYIKSFFKGYRPASNADHLLGRHVEDKGYMDGSQSIMSWDPDLASSYAGFM